MSYGVFLPCHNCTKKETCTDGKDVQSAVQVIHGKTYEQGHQGSGSVILSCVKMDAIHK